MDKEPPQQPEESEKDNVVEFPISECMRARQRHPAGKLGRKSIQEILREIAEAEKDDDES